jgi:hypothetical protein
MWTESPAALRLALQDAYEDETFAWSDEEYCAHVDAENGGPPWEPSTPGHWRAVILDHAIRVLEEEVSAADRAAIEDAMHARFCFDHGLQLDPVGQGWYRIRAKGEAQD